MANTDHARRALVIKMLKEGHSVKVVASELGLSHQRIYKIIQQVGLTKEYRWKQEEKGS